MVEGLHVPVMPLGDIVFRVGAVVPLHNVNTVSKSGTMVVVTVTAKVKGELHWFGFGVKI